MEPSKILKIVGASTHLLYPDQGGKSLLQILKGDETQSSQDPCPGLKYHPFNFELVTKFKESNSHHSTCIETKKEATVGLGLVTEEERKKKAEMAQMATMPPAAPAGPAKPGGIQLPQKPRGVNKEDDLDLSDRSTSKAEMALDELCRVSWQDVIGDVAEDYFQTGNGFVEVVRAGNEIVGLHHIPAAHVYVVVEDDLYNIHYEINPFLSGSLLEGGDSAASARTFVPFGEKEAYLARTPAASEAAARISEVIHFRKPSAASRWYGVPDWLAAVPKIELSHCSDQFQLDFFMNRGVPEFLLFVTGGEVSPQDWTKLEDSLRAGVGLGNSHKSIAMNLVAPEIGIHLEKLESDNRDGDSQQALEEQWALSIVTAHRVPPLLAGIQIPGKLGASNEIVSAMKAFQTLVIGPSQKVFETILNKTLGGKKGVSGLKAGDFKFRKITDEMEVEQLDPISRMRQEFTAPVNKDRDPNKGLKE